MQHRRGDAREGRRAAGRSRLAGAAVSVLETLYALCLLSLMAGLLGFAGAVWLAATLMKVTLDLLRKKAGR